MPDSDSSDILVTGVGVTTAIGQGKADFIEALLKGHSNFSVMKRPGRQFVPDVAAESGAAATRFLGAEIPAFAIPEMVPRSLVRTASLSGQVALTTLHEAWNDARLGEVDPARVGLVVGGSNFQQRELTLTHETFRARLPFLRPTYGLSFMDSDVSGMCTEVFGICGLAYTLGGASASGQLAVIHAIQAVDSGQVDVCIALGALMDLSYWEAQGFRALGAMGSDVFANEPDKACRPFDQRRDGFIFGECCGAVVVERTSTAARRAIDPYARVSGWAVQMDANRNPNPSFDGEVSVLRKALARAALAPEAIDYINPHGTGSSLGDTIELKAIEHCGLKHAYINATKSLIGHGLSAAGAVEMIATLLQMRARQIHPTRNLDDPMDHSFNWARHPVAHTIQRAVKMSLGFSGINTAVCVERL